MTKLTDLLLSSFFDTEDEGDVFLRNVVISPNCRYAYIGLFLGSLFDLKYVSNMFLRHVGLSPNCMFLNAI
jgi:hypothetical protein